MAAYNRTVLIFMRCCAKIRTYNNYSGSVHLCGNEMYFRLWGSLPAISCPELSARITNKHATKKKKKKKEFAIFNFVTDVITISDHTPYNFTGAWSSERVFQHRNDSNMLPRLSQRVGCCRGRIAMPKLTPGSLRSYGDDRRIDRGSQKKFRSLFIDTVLSMVCSMGFSQLAVESLDPRLDDSVLSFLNSSSAWKNFLQKKKFSRTGPWSRKFHNCTVLKTSLNKSNDTYDCFAKLSLRQASPNYGCA